MPDALRYRDPHLCDALAARYTAGHMSARSRRRLEQLSRREAVLDAALDRWSTLLAPLQTELAWRATLPTPPANLWPTIARQIAPPSAPSAQPILKPASPPQPPRQPAPFWQRLWPWRLGTLAGGLATLLLVRQLSLPPEVAEPAYLAPLSRAGEVALVVSGYQGDAPGRSRLVVQWTQQQPPLEVQGYLWAQLPDQAELVYLGPFDAEHSEWRVDPTRWHALTRSRRLLVSVDRSAPDPQDPLYAGPCLQLSYR